MRWVDWIVAVPDLELENRPLNAHNESTLVGGSWNNPALQSERSKGNFYEEATLSVCGTGIIELQKPAPLRTGGFCCCDGTKRHHLPSTERA
ncbi:hypothetical protein EP837_03212 [Sphingobium sp. EP60837]|nr:hypothetical protein EP837_03212 [Sphingobium sp. EP60837]